MTTSIGPGGGRLRAAAARVACGGRRRNRFDLAAGI